MDSARYQALKRHFAELAELGGEERRARLAELEAQDPELAAELGTLFAHHESVAGDALGGLVPSEDEAQRSAPLPERIADYRVLGELGRGGMGTVYEAEQESPRRRVALKLIRAEGTTPKLLRRFEHEAELLGRLQHPGIAQVYAAGTWESQTGPQPYFAMERVEGRPLLEWASQHAPRSADRLRLIARICDAVQHAHERGVIHRDLKPANILVTQDGQPKVLDFGVARATDADIAAVTLRTGVGELVGTVPYMSPEQAGCEPDELDARSDVYALGVLTFELLTGRLPHEIDGVALHEAVRTIREDEPTKLSVLDRALKGDVETIVSKALAKEKERRYPTAAALADDLRRHLSNEPIVARPTSALYQLSKFTRRNRALVGGISSGLAIAFVALVLALLHSLEQTRTARAAESQALLAADRANISSAQATIEAGRGQAAIEILSRVPEERRAWEWHYLNALLDTSLGRIQLEAPVTCVNFGEGPLELASVDREGRLQHWDASREEGQLQETIELGWTPLSPSIQGQPPRYASLRPLEGVAFEVVVVDVADGSILWRAPAPDECTKLTLSHDASLIVVHSENELWAYRVGESEPFARHELPLIRGASFDGSDEQLVAICYETYYTPAYPIDTVDGSLSRPARLRHSVHDIVVHDGGQHLIGLGLRKQLYDYRLPDTDPTPIAGLGGNPSALASSPDERFLVSAGKDRSVVLWDLASDAGPRIYNGHQEPVVQLAYARDGSRFVSRSSDALCIWPSQIDDAHHVLEAHTSYAYALAFAENGRRLVSGSWDMKARLWDPSSGAPLGTLPELNQGTVYSLDAATQGHRVAKGTEGRLLLASTDPSEPAFELDLGPGRVNWLALSDDGSRLAVLRLRWLELWDLDPPAQRWIREVTFAYQGCKLAMSGDGRLVAAAPRPDQVAVYDAQTGDELALFSDLGADQHSFAFSDDARLLAAGDAEGRTRIWEWETGRLHATLEGHLGRVFAVDFHPDGSRLATGSDDRTIRIWDPELEVCVAQLQGHSEYIYDLEFSPSGEILASASGDHDLRLWSSVPTRLR